MSFLQAQPGRAAPYFALLDDHRVNRKSSTPPPPNFPAVVTDQSVFAAAT